MEGLIGTVAGLTLTVMGATIFFIWRGGRLYQSFLILSKDFVAAVSANHAAHAELHARIDTQAKDTSQIKQMLGEIKGELKRMNGK